MRRRALAQAEGGEVDAIAAGDVEEIDLALAAVGIDQHELVAAGREIGHRVDLAAGNDVRLLLAQPIGAPGALPRRRQVELVDRLAGLVHDLQLRRRGARRYDDQHGPHETSPTPHYASSSSPHDVQQPSKRGGRFSRNAATPSEKSRLAPAWRCRSRSTSSCALMSFVALARTASLMRRNVRLGPAARRLASAATSPANTASS